MKKICITIGILCLSLVIKAENLEPSFTHYNEELYVTMEKGEPVAYTDVDIEIYYPSTKSINYLSSHTIYLSSFDEISPIEAYVLVPYKNGKFKKIQITEFKTSGGTDEDIFVDDSKEITMQFPGLTEGSKVNIKYSVRTEELHFFRPYYFNKYLDCDEMRYTVKYSDNIKLTLKKENFDNAKVKSSTTTEKENTIVSFSIHNTKAYDLDGGEPSIAFFVPHILPILNATNNGKGWKTFLKAPVDLYNWYYKLISSVDDSPSDAMKDIASQIKKDSKTNEEIVVNTYRWVQKNVRYVAYESGLGGVIPRSASTVCKKRFGDCKDMSNLVRGLLKLNNINTNLVWIGTRALPYTYDDIYSKNCDNHMIAAYKKDDNWIFLDATDPNGVYGLPTTHIQGKQAMIGLGENDFELVLVPVIKAAENNLNYNMKLEIQNTDLRMKGTMNAQGFSAGSLKNAFLYNSEKDKEKFIKNLIDPDHITLNSFKINNDDKVSDKISVDMDMTMVDMIKRIGNNIIVNIHFNRLMGSGKIDTSHQRSVPMEIEYNRVNKNHIELPIPKGYQLTSMPENVEYVKPNLTFRIVYSMKNNVLSCDEEYQINYPDLMIHENQFDDYNQMKSIAQNAYNKSLNLKKIN